MAKGDKQEVAKAKAAVAQAYKSGKSVSPKGYPAPKGGTKSSIKNPWAKEDIKAAKAAKARAKTNALNKMKANPKLNLSPTSSALERARAKKGSK